MSERRKKWRWASVLVLCCVFGMAVFFYFATKLTATKLQNAKISSGNLASLALAELAIKPAASMAGYSRAQFGSGWETAGGCDMREHILAEDLISVTLKSKTNCTVMSGVLHDPYSGKVINFRRGTNSNLVQIDHIVAVGDAWRTGAQMLALTGREQLYNDPLELIAVLGLTNDQKGDADAAGWLPPNKPFDCRYVARQIAVKIRYKLWVTQAEHNAMQKVLKTCPTQQLPTVNN